MKLILKNETYFSKTDPFYTFFLLSATTTDGAKLLYAAVGYTSNEILSFFAFFK